MGHSAEQSRTKWPLKAKSSDWGGSQPIETEEFAEDEMNHSWRIVLPGLCWWRKNSTFGAQQENAGNCCLPGKLEEDENDIIHS